MLASILLLASACAPGTWQVVSGQKDDYLVDTRDGEVWIRGCQHAASDDQKDPSVSCDMAWVPMSKKRRAPIKNQYSGSPK